VGGGAAASQRTPILSQISISPKRFNPRISPRGTYYGKTSPSSMVLHRIPRPPPSHSPVHLRSFSLTPLSLLPKPPKPSRPEPQGEIRAFFPQTNQTVHIHETKGQYTERWQKYVKDLGAVAAPSKIGGPNFGTRVRSRRIWRNGERGRQKRGEDDLRPPPPQSLPPPRCSEEE
jgi:hypothetical protein